MSYLYLISAETTHADLCKVGIASNIDRRLKTLQTACPYPLRVYEVWDCATAGLARGVERAAHSWLRQWRVNGEWFEISPLDAVKVITGLLCDVSKRLDGDWPDIPPGGFGELGALLL